MASFDDVEVTARPMTPARRHALTPEALEMMDAIAVGGQEGTQPGAPLHAGFVF